MVIWIQTWMAISLPSQPPPPSNPKLHRSFEATQPMRIPWKAIWFMILARQKRPNDTTRHVLSFFYREKKNGNKTNGQDMFEDRRPFRPGGGCFSWGKMKTTMITIMIMTINIAITTIMITTTISIAIPDAPCMEYLPTCTIYLSQM